MPVKANPSLHTLEMFVVFKISWPRLKGFKVNGEGGERGHIHAGAKIPGLQRRSHALMWFSFMRRALVFSVFSGNREHKDLSGVLQVQLLGVFSSKRTLIYLTLT